MMLGLRTVIYHVPDLQGAKAWYSRVATIADPFGNLVGLIENPHFALE